MSHMTTTERWEKEATAFLKGKKVKRLRYLTIDEQEEYGWSKAAPVIEFTDGTWVMASMDDEGNGAGAFFTSHDGGLDVIPVIGNF